MIGVIVLGRMGRAIAGRLEDVGETIVVWNRTALFSLTALLKVEHKQ